PSPAASASPSTSQFALAASATRSCSLAPWTCCAFQSRGHRWPHLDNSRASDIVFAQEPAGRGSQQRSEVPARPDYSAEPRADLSPAFRYSCPHPPLWGGSAPLGSLRSSAMEPLKDSSTVTRLPGAEDIRLREPPHNFEAEQALLGAILMNNAAYQRVAEF